MAEINVALHSLSRHFRKAGFNGSTNGDMLRTENDHAISFLFRGYKFTGTHRQIAQWFPQRAVKIDEILVLCG